MERSRQRGKIRLALLDVLVPPPDGHDRDWALAQNLKNAVEAAPQDVVMAPGVDRDPGRVVP